MAIDKIGHVRSQIASFSGKLRPKEEHDGVKIVCPFHAGGHERTPSCKVNITNAIGRFYCFGCHTKGDWNLLCEATGMQGFKRSDQVHDVFAFAMPEIHYSEKAPELEDIDALKRYNIPTPWRGIELETLQLFGARFPKHRFYPQNDFFYLPVHVNKKYVGGVYARRVVTKEGKERGEISYINTKGRWSKQYVFGYNIARQRRGPLWYVEGPRDCLKISQLGGRAVAGLGSYVGPHKIKLIEALDPPAVIIATDPDEAGDRARAYLKEHLPMIPVHDAVFPEGRDPANFTPRSFSRMMHKFGFDYEYEAA